MFDILRCTRSLLHLDFHSIRGCVRLSNGLFVCVAHDNKAKYTALWLQLVMRGHNIVTEWCFRPSSIPHAPPYTQKASKNFVFPLFDSLSQTDRLTYQRMDRHRIDGWTDKVACPHLKTAQHSTNPFAQQCV